MLFTLIGGPRCEPDPVGFRREVDVSVAELGGVKPASGSFLVFIHSDVSINGPDEQSIITYVSQFLEHFPGLEEVGLPFGF